MPIRQHRRFPFYHDGQYIWKDPSQPLVDVDRHYSNMKKYPWEDSTITPEDLKKFDRFLKLPKIPDAIPLCEAPLKLSKVDRKSRDYFFDWVALTDPADRANHKAVTDANREQVEKDLFQTREVDSVPLHVRRAIKQIFVSGSEDGWRGRFPVYVQGMPRAVQKIGIHLLAPLNRRNGDTRVHCIRNLRLLFLAVQYFQQSREKMHISSVDSLGGASIPDPSSHVSEAILSENIDILRLPVLNFFDVIVTYHKNTILLPQTAFDAAYLIWKSYTDFCNSWSWKFARRKLRLAVNEDTEPFLAPHLQAPAHFFVFRGEENEHKL